MKKSPAKGKQSKLSYSCKHCGKPTWNAEQEWTGYCSEECEEADNELQE